MQKSAFILIYVNQRDYFWSKKHFNMLLSVLLRIIFIFYFCISNLFVIFAAK